MTPVYYNGNDYYKKMLELQGRLRRSEEERIRLEERFSLLEHESRSRHETCINRLRMRYIEFLEEQQARDERNHKLLGALDRVDTSLALISAKTDRLGTMRRQCEAACLLKNWYINERTSGSVTVDSGVASRNTEGRKPVRRQQGRGSIDRIDNFASNPRLGDTNMTLETASRSTRPNFSPSKASSDKYHDTRWPGIVRNERTQMPSHLSSLTAAIDKANESSMITETRERAHVFVDKRPDGVSQLLQQSPRNYLFNYPRVNRFRYDSTVAQSPSRSPKDHSTLGYPRDLVDIQRSSRGANLFRKEGYKTPIGNYSGFYDDAVISSVRSPSRFHHFADGSGQGNDEELYNVGGTVENELERYMSKIPRLYREAELRKSREDEEEFDHEQNTSGDLLNVTLSDDGVEFTPEGAKMPLECEGLSDRAMQTGQASNREMNNLGMNKEAKIDETYSTGKAKETRPDGLNESSRHVQHGNSDFRVTYDDDDRQLQAITSLTNPTPDIDDEGLVASNEKIALLAKNGISLDVTRANTETVTRSSRNNENIARSHENSNREVDYAVETREIGSKEEREITAEMQEMTALGSLEIDDSLEKNNRVGHMAELNSTMTTDVNESKYRVVSGEELDTGNNFNESTENLETWNVSGLEKRVESKIIIKEELESIGRGPEQIPSGSADRDSGETNVSRPLNAGELRKDDEKIDEYTAVTNETSHPNPENDWNPNTNTEESFGNRSDIDQQKSETMNHRLREHDRNDDASLVSSNGNRTVNHQELLPAEISGGGTQESDYPVDPNTEYGAAEETYVSQDNASYAEEKYNQDPYQRYEYPVNEQYQESEENYQTQPYNTENNFQYNEDSSGAPGQEYRYEANDQTQYQDYVQQDPRYSEDPNQAYSSVDVNQEYPVDVNGQYVTDPNKRFTVDPNQGYSESHQYPDNVVQNQDVNQEYQAEVYDQSGVSENDGFVAESNDNQDYERHQSSVMPEQSQHYGQVYEMSEQEEIQSYGQEQPTGLDHDSSHAQDHDRSSNAYEPPPQTSIQRDHSVSEESMSSRVIEEINDEVDQTNIHNKEVLEKKDKDFIKSLLDSDTESTIERNVSNTESDFDFN